MHEMALMAGVFEIITAVMAEHPGKKVTRVTMEVGELTHALPDSLQMCFAAFARGTVCEGAELEIIEIPVVLKCQECGWQGRTTGSFVALCPDCQSPRTEITAGRELRVSSLEVEDDENRD
ncbi:MAG: hydrogenase maturation nickel metallochaperone HypA [Bacillota bacterium]|uniref:Hydrogenase maturation factor HypA n=2 Tax=Carboxydocella TaxID=178898 RepID=A0A1T4RRH6_9FIRM|nr:MULTISPECIES: hydrogenase maturation nickel metallochaperone HypA [Carboxydocella]AVX21881.1 Hydrogenase-3 nickel incorporation protein HypA [Carboxydocella thermautotrophica]AVX32284.1 Hydrogenase-3 nickel incorporation protein HypA [Carboxydocella thermautotrophica]SKA18487.1 hydrogenase nickel incorporation protein HypA/HybF [Carboxydocella sporoproducens DSM 16521]GAW28076.1 hydrogenase nickel incorporation protein HypA [Carboxydocella sp. ULO1]GAW32545.1 hydrogenase nickel incorporatio